jgi:hypothetical protein
MAAQVEHVSLRDVLISMRASARTLFESGGDIHGRINAAMTGWRGAAGTPPCGFPVFLGQAGVKKELGIFDPSKTLFTFSGFCWGTRWPSSRSWWLSTSVVIANPAEQGVAISGFEIAAVAALPRNDTEGITTSLEKPTLFPPSAPSIAACHG